MTEHSKLEADIIELLRYTGWMAVRTHDGKNRPSTRGTCDVWALKDGHFLAVEVKVGKDKMSPEQDKFMDEVVGHRGIACVARRLEHVVEASKLPINKNREKV